VGERPLSLTANKEIVMAGAAHLGVALAAKRLSPRTPLWLLVVSSYAIDIVFMAFMAAGKEHMPKRAARSEAQPNAGSAPEAAATAVTTNPWSHGLAMALVWTGLFTVLATQLSRDRRTGALVGALVFGHWLVDLVTKPMTGVFPGDTGLPLLLEGSPTVGLGLYRSRKVANAVEYGSLALGAAIYAQTVLQERAHRD
jgi:hypothetical protein